MKKLIILATVIVASVVANAAATSWKVAAANVYSSDATTKYSGSVYIFCADLVSVDTVKTALGAASSASAASTYLAGVALHTATAATGTISNSSAANQFSTEALVADGTYSFYYVFVDDDKYFVSSEKSGLIAQANSTVNIAFGNQQSATQAAGAWAAVAVPEPTSGLLMLLGLAGLTLKRKRA